MESPNSLTIVGPGRTIRADTPAEVLDGQAFRFAARRYGELVTIDNDADPDSVEFWHRPGESFGPCRTRAAEQPREEHAEGGGSPATEHVSSVRIIASDDRLSRNFVGATR